MSYRKNVHISDICKFIYTNFREKKTLINQHEGICLQGKRISSCHKIMCHCKVGSFSRDENHRKSTYSDAFEHVPSDKVLHGTEVSNKPVPQQPCLVSVNPVIRTTLDN